MYVRGFPYQPRSPYYNVGSDSYQPYTMSQPPQQYDPRYTQDLTPFEQYAKPEQPNNWYIPEASYEQMEYPQPTTNHTSTSDQPSTFVNPFQTESGQLDVNKMLSTVGQLADTVQQVSPLFKQIGAMIKVFR